MSAKINRETEAVEFERELERADEEPKPLWPIIVAAVVLAVSVVSSIAGVARTMGWLDG